MFQKVLVGIDGNDGGRDAIMLAQELVAAGGELILAHVHGAFPLVGRGANAEFEAAERDRAMKLLDLARRESNVQATTRCIGATGVGRGLHELAESAEADLLVVGATRRTLLGRVALGDDTRDALNGAPCAVAIAPVGYAKRSHTLSEIGVAYNGSNESRQALDCARRIATRWQARLSTFEAVTEPDEAFPGELSVPDEGARSSIDEAVERARQRAAALGGVEPHSAYGDPAEELTLYSASVDLLVVGSRDYGPVGRLVHGSTSRKLTRTARSPLLLLHRAA